MNNLDTLLNRTLELGSLMSLGCNEFDSIKEQLITIDEAVLELQELRASVEPILKKFDEEIARIDGIRLAKGAVGIGLMLIGQSNSDSEDFLVQVGSELALEIGNDFLDEAIHDENHLREVKKIFSNLATTIEVFTQQGVWLSNLGYNFFLSSDSNFESELQKKSKNLLYLAEQIAKLSVTVKLDFCFTQPELMHNQVTSARLALEKLNEIKKQLETLLSSVDRNEIFNANDSTISALFSIFGAAIIQIKFSNTSELNIVIDNQQYNLSEIIQKCIEFEQKIKNILSNANCLDKIFSYCLEDAVFLKTLEQAKPKYSIDELCEKSTAVIQTLQMRLNFDELIVMEQNLSRMYRTQVQLRNLYGQLDAVIKKINKQAAYQINLDVIKALLVLIGQSLSGLGLDENGIIVLYNQLQYEEFNSVINKCVNLKQNIEVPTQQLSSLVFLGKECIQYPSLITELKLASSTKTINDIKNEIKAYSRTAKGCLKFGDQSAMQQQVMELTAAKEVLLPIQKNILNIINTIEVRKIIYLKPSTIESLLHLFGNVCAVEFNQKGELFVDYGNKSEKILEILKFCQKFQSKIENLIHDVESRIQQAQDSLNDPALMKLHQRQQKKKQLQIKSAITACILILVSPLAWLCWQRFHQEQLRWNALALVSSAQDITKAQNISELQQSRNKIQQAIASVEKIPNSFASAYITAQKDIAEFRRQLEEIEKKLQIEEDAVAKLESTKQLALNAAILVQNPPHPVTVWNEASYKWQQAISILESIPESSFIATDVKVKLEKYRDNHNIILTRLSNENKANDALGDAKKLAWSAAKLTQNPPQPVANWKQANSNIAEAIKLLKTIPTNSPLYPQVQLRLKDYSTNYDLISKRVITEENAVNNFKQAQSLVKQVELIAQQTPYTLVQLQNALAKNKQALNLLNSIPSATTISAQASELAEVCSRNYNTIYDSFQAIKACDSSQSSYCFDSNHSLYLESVSSNLSPF